jgi:hypothetical protein
MIVLEYKGERPKEQVQDAQQDRRQDAEIEALLMRQPPIVSKQGLGRRTIGSKMSS